MHTSFGQEKEGLNSMCITDRDVDQNSMLRNGSEVIHTSERHRRHQGPETRTPIGAHTTNADDHSGSSRIDASAASTRQSDRNRSTMGNRSVAEASMHK
jgi:hypothetical protein